MPGEAHDLDETFERVVDDVGAGRRSVFTMGKLGILWELDAKAGDYRNATALGYQN